MVYLMALFQVFIDIITIRYFYIVLTQLHQKAYSHTFQYLLITSMAELINVSYLSLCFECTDLFVK